MEWIKKWFGKTGVILIIDDNDEIAGLLAMLLESNGFKTKRARDGLEGIELVQKINPALILLDVTMPRMDGFDVLLKIKSDPKKKSIPVIMCTDHGGLNDVERCCKWGADGYILKPFEAERVLEKVKSSLEKQSS